MAGGSRGREVTWAVCAGPLWKWGVGEDAPCTPTPGSFPQGAGAPCVAEEGQPDMNGDLVSGTSLELGATTQGLFTSNLAIEAALSVTGGLRADVGSGGRVASVEQRCYSSCPCLGWGGLLEVSSQKGSRRVMLSVV